MKTKRKFSTSRRTLPGKRKHSGTSFRENQNTYFMSNAFSFLENYAIYGIVAKNKAESDRTSNMVWCREDAICMQGNCRKCIVTLAFPILLKLARKVLCISSLVRRPEGRHD